MAAPSTARPRRLAVLGALMLAAFTFNTAENLPVGLIELISADLRVSPAAVGRLVTAYGLTVAVVSLPAARATRAVPRRLLLSLVLGTLVLAALVSAAVSSYGLLLGARLATALAQALFWAVMGPVAVGLFPDRYRGRVVGVLSVAGSLALVLGVPLGTWLGQRTAWQAPLAALAGLGLLSLVTVAALLPTTRPEESHGAYGTAPDARRFAAVLTVTALSATGAFTGFTYLVTFLGEVSGFADGAVSTLLMVFGLAALAGVTLTGPFLDRFPRGALVAPVVAQAAGMLGLWAAGGSQVGAVVGLALFGGSLGPLFMATQNQMLRVAPGRTEIALAANSGAFNAGIGGGALLGGALLSLLGVRGTFLVGGLLALAALAALAGAERTLPSPDRHGAAGP